MTIPDSVKALVSQGKILTSQLVEAGKQGKKVVTPGEVAEKLYHKHERGGHGEEVLASKKEEDGQPATSDLDEARKLGDFGDSNPSDLFLTIYHDILLTLEKDPWAAVVSPPLLGSTGVVQLSIVSVIPDIIQHYCDCIVSTQDELILGTNYWENSNSANHIADAFRELSKRAQSRGDKKVVVKMMYDRGNLKQLSTNHVEVFEKEWTSDVVNLPKLEEMPGLDFQLINYHRPVLGTFHSKYMIVDRKVALLNSNNIQDRPNVEMMIHIEGKIVQSFYDMALYSWNVELKPHLPLLKDEFAPDTDFKFGLDNEYMTQAVLDGKAGEARVSEVPADKRRFLSNWTSDCTKDTPTPCEIQQDAPEARFISGRKISITDHLNCGKQPDTTATIEPPAVEDEAHEFRPHHVHSKHAPVPMALVNRKPHGRPGHGDTHNPQDVAWLSALKHAKQKVFIQTPTFNAKPVVEGVIEAVKRGITVVLFVDVGFNDGGEALPLQGGTNEEVAKRLFKSLETKEEKDRLQYFWYTAKDQKKPINAHINHRNCHVKLMIVDDHIGIQGNGNQDAQSWFHSQEINVMIDSRQICSEWMDLILRNQNTLEKGRLDDDGIWRDEEANELTDSTGIKSGPGSVIKGVIGSIKRVQGKGGF